MHVRHSAGPAEAEADTEYRCLCDGALGGEPRKKATPLASSQPRTLSTSVWPIGSGCARPPSLLTEEEEEEGRAGGVSTKVIWKCFLK